MATTSYLLKDGSTLEVTTVDKVITYKESVVTTVDKTITYKETTTKIIPAPLPTSKYLSLPLSGIKDVSGQSNVIIENLRFENTSAASIKVWNASNITIRNCFFNKSAKEAIDMQNATNITITNCLFNHVETGVYALNCQTIKVNNNQFVNMRRRPGEGRGQFIQFNSCGGTGNEIIGNRGENFPGESDPEDHISLFNSSNVVVRGNMLKGGGPSDSGSGIMVGDNGGSNIIVDGNTLLTTGNAGIGVAGGNNITVINNKIYSARTSVSNNPLYIWAQAGQEGKSSGVTVKSNRSYWIHKDGWDNSGGWNSGNIPNTSWEAPTKITLAEMAFPDHLITFLTPDELITIRK